MNKENSNFMPLKHVKVEENTNDFDNNIEYFIGDGKNSVPKNEIKCKNKCFDIVDKWIARVVVKVPTGNNWHNIVAREIALLKVRYPFLTEQQLKGKALMKFGIPSMCGNVVRTGVGKVTGAIAKELSRKKATKTRIPSAFKVLKKFLPCINKFEAKSETNIWTQENQRIPTLYDRETRTFTAEMIQQKELKPENIKTNYGKPPMIQTIVMNPMNRLKRLSPELAVINNASEQISCATATPTKKPYLEPQRKALLSQFNDTHDPIIINDNNKLEEIREKFKRAMDSPENIHCIRMITNYSNGNVYDNIQKNVCNEEQSEMKMLRYSQMSEESIDVMKHTRRILEKKLPRNNRNNFENQMKRFSVEKPKTVVEEMEIDSDVTEFEFDNSNCPYRKQPLSKSHANKYENQNSITKDEHKSSVQYISSLNYSPSYSTAQNLSHGVKRHQYHHSVDVLSSPQKISRHNDHHYFQELQSHCSSYDPIHEFYDSLTISNESIDEKPIQLSKVASTTSLKFNRVNSSFEPTPLNEQISSIEECDNNCEASMSQSYAKSSYFKFSSMINDQFTPLSTLRCSNNILNPWESMNHQNFGCETITGSQESITTCILTPDIGEILLETNVPAEFHSGSISTEKSVDLLERENATSPSHSNIRSTLDVHSQLHRINCNSQEYTKCDKQKSFMLSDFCSEYDKGWNRLIRKNQNFMNKRRTSTIDNVEVSMLAIKVAIKKAIKILDEHCNNN